MLDWRMNVRGGMGGGCGSGGSSTGLCRPQRPILTSVLSCCYRLQAVNKLNDRIYYRVFFKHIDTYTYSGINIV